MRTYYIISLECYIIDTNNHDMSGSSVFCYLQLLC